MKIGYARVSTSDQDLGRQMSALKKAGCKIIYEEKISGTSTQRLALNKLVSTLRPGDVVIIQKLDRLGRSLKHLIELVNLFKEKEVGFVSLSDNFDTTTSNGRFLFNIMGAMAEFERDLISERTKDGLRHAKSKGIKLGKPKGLSKIGKLKAASAKSMYLNEKKSVAEICRALEISRPTFYRYLSVNVSV